MTKGVIFSNRAMAVCLSALLLFAVASPGSADTVVKFQTALGDFDVQLYDSVAPITVANFLNYVNDDDYTNSFFHRLMTDFVLQGGGFTYDPNVGIESPWPSVPTDPPIVNEFDASRSNLRGTIAMAKTAAGPDTATSQFFFNLGDNSANLDNQNGGFTVFGEVIGNGMDVVDLLAAQGVESKSDAHSAFGTLPVYSGSEPWNTRLLMYDIGFVPGDANLDGSVSEDDLDIIIHVNWLATGATWTENGDVTEDTVVNQLDINAILRNWLYGVLESPEPQFAAMPEPATLGMLLLGGLAMLSRRK